MTEPVRLGDEFGATVYAELREQVLDVRRHRLRADRELRSDCPLRPALRKEVEHLVLPERQVGLR